MNAAADPCQDFHEYVCGHWNAHFDGYSGTHWEEIKINFFDVVDLAMIEAMSDPIRKLSKKLQKRAKAVEYLADLYREYRDEYSREQLGVRPLQQLLAQVFDTEEQWPLLSNESISLPTFRASNGTRVPYSEILEFRSFWDSWLMNQFDNIFNVLHFNTPTEIQQWLDCYVEASILGLHPFISIVNRDKKTLKWKANELILVRINIQDDMTERYAKFRVLKHVACVIFGHSYHNWNSSLDYAIFEVLEFYQAISRLFPTTKSESSEAFQLQPKMKEITLGELKRRYSSPHFDWTLFLNKYASRTGASLRYTDRDTVRVQVDQLAVFKPFTNLVVKTPIRVLKNAMALQLVRAPSMISLLDEKNRELLNDDSTSSLISEHFPGMNFVMKNFVAFGPIFIRLYVDYVGPQKLITARDRVSEMMRHLKDTFRDSLKEDHNWLDDKTRQNALEKLEAMRMMIAFPDWIFDDDVLDEEFGFSEQTLNTTKDSQNFIKGHYAASFLAFRRLGVAAEFRKNDQILDANREFFFFKSEATYSEFFNLLGMSYALLSEPFFDVHYPVAINYGNLGSILAHEMTHAFDHDGRLYDKHGEMANWWTEHVSQHFEKLSKCFVRQYDGLVEPITGVKVNGTTTLGDNIADNGGLNQAYRAFEKIAKLFEDSDQFFPSHFTPDQLFFISYSINWCSEGEDTPENSEFIRHDSHSPNKFRVNIPLANNVQFAEAFNCSQGTPMNPKFKCSVW